MFYEVNFIFMQYNVIFMRYSESLMQLLTYIISTEADKIRYSSVKLVLSKQSDEDSTPIRLFFVNYTPSVTVHKRPAPELLRGFFKTQAV